jgi:hypothetical protein
LKTKFTAALTGAVLLATAATLSGCGSDKNKKLDDWAEKLCARTAPQTALISSANTSLSQVPGDGKPAALKSADSAAFGQLVDAYAKLAGIVNRAGDPPVDKGTTIRTTTVHNLDQLSAAYQKLKKQVDALDTKDQGKFADGLNSVGENSGKIKGGSDALDGLRRGDLGQAMAQQPKCAVPSPTPVSATTTPSPSGSPSGTGAGGTSGGGGGGGKTPSASASPKSSGTGKPKSGKSPTSAKSPSGDATKTPAATVAPSSSVGPKD